MQTAINRENILQHLLEYELQLSGKTLVNLLDSTNYRFDFTVTLEQRVSFRIYSIPLLKKVFKFNTNKAKAVFKWYVDNMSLRIKD